MVVGLFVVMAPGGGVSRPGGGTQAAGKGFEEWDIVLILQVPGLVCLHAEAP